MQDVADAIDDDDACECVFIQLKRVLFHHDSRMLRLLTPLKAVSDGHAPADDGSSDSFIAAADDAPGIITFDALEAAETGCEFLILMG